jgi:hypothetical protein
MSSRLPRHLLVVHPWRSRAGRQLHRELDRAGWQALARDRDPGRMPAAGEVSVMTNPRALLAVLSQRTSTRGQSCLSGWLGKARVIGFEGDPDQHGNPTWRIFVAEPEPRDGPPGPTPKPPGRDSASGRTGGASKRQRAS